MNKRQAIEHAAHVESLFQAARSIAAAVIERRESRSHAGLVRLIVADCDRAHGGYALLRIALPGNGTPNEDYGTLDGLHNAYYRAVVSGARDQYLIDAERLMSEAIARRNKATSAAA